MSIKHLHLPQLQFAWSSFSLWHPLSANLPVVVSTVEYALQAWSLSPPMHEPGDKVEVLVHILLQPLHRLLLLNLYSGQDWKKEGLPLWIPRKDHNLGPFLWTKLSSVEAVKGWSQNVKIQCTFQFFFFLQLCTFYNITEGFWHPDFWKSWIAKLNQVNLVLFCPMKSQQLSNTKPNQAWLPTSLNHHDKYHVYGYL